MFETRRTGDTPKESVFASNETGGNPTGRSFDVDPLPIEISASRQPLAERPQPAEVAADDPGLDDPSYTILDEGSVFIPTYNLWYRDYHHNMAMLGNVIAPRVMAGRPNSELFRVLEVGCSKARDTWSLASVMELHDIPYHIDAVDVNPKVLEEATAPYTATLDELREYIQAWDVPPEAVNFFEHTDATHIQPTAALRRNVTFRREDFRYATPSGIYDAVIANNVISHYKRTDNPDIQRMLSNIAGSLRPGGLFTFSGQGTAEIARIKGLFDRYGLQHAEDLCERDTSLAFYRKIEPSPRPSWRQVLSAILNRP